MDNTKKQTFSSVISIDPYKGTYYKGASNRLTSEEVPAFSKDQYAIAFLSTKHFITAIVDISKNLPDEDIYDALENKIYEELALDMAIEYHIKYVEAPMSDENSRYFHVFVVDPVTLEEEYADVAQAIKYIDQIIPEPLLLRSLYQKEIIDDNGVHAFIYFQEDDAFFTLYNDQQFVYTKSLKFSFLHMHERFCELLGEQIDYTMFLQLLSEEGLSATNTEYQKHLIKLFGEIFLHVNDVLTYAKRAFELEEIDQVYIGSQVSAISGLDEYSQTYLGLTSISFDFDYGYDSEEWYIDQVHYLMHLYTQMESEKRYDADFTIYHRPPPFLKRKSGQVIAISIASIIIAMAYPVTFWTMTYAEEIHKQLLTEEYDEVHNIKVTREATIKLKQANKDRVFKLLDNERAEYDSKKATLEKIHDVKVNYPMKAKILKDFATDLDRYKVRLVEARYNEEDDKKTFTFALSAKQDKQITALLEYLTKTKTKQFQFLLEEITYDDEKFRYRGEMKAVLR